MKSFRAAMLLLVTCGAVLFFASPAQAYTRHTWRLTSPDHEQTFSYGSEQRRVWAQRGHDNHLVVLLDFTNDPYVDRNDPRQYDNFSFSFPEVRLGSDGHTFYYRSEYGRSIPVARKGPDILGINEIQLLPNAWLRVDKPHGYLTLTLLIQDYAD